MFGRGVLKMMASSQSVLPIILYRILRMYRELIFGTLFGSGRDRTVPRHWNRVLLIGSLLILMVL
ncbi:hypothetical protein LINPERHAP2_LOCUS36843 [Linum perenne]